MTQDVSRTLHFDHAGALELLPDDVPMVVQRREPAAGYEGDAIARNFFHPRDYSFAAERMVEVDGDHDLLGDGSVRLLLTPGHTPGHQSVQIGEQLVRKTLLAAASEAGVDLADPEAIEAYVEEYNRNLAA